MMVLLDGRATPAMRRGGRWCARLVQTPIVALRAGRLVACAEQQCRKVA